MSDVVLLYRCFVRAASNTFRDTSDKRIHKRTIALNIFLMHLYHDFGTIITLKISLLFLMPRHICNSTGSVHLHYVLT